MRRAPAPRASTAVAVVATIVAVLAVMFPGLGFGQAHGIHGGSPTDVFMQRAEDEQVCAPIGVNADGVTIMPLQVEVNGPSHVLVYFSFELGGLDTNERAQVNPNLDGGGGADFDPVFSGNSDGRVPGTVMHVFPDVDPGTHTVDIFSSIFQVGPRDQGQLLASMGDCVLTVFVIPVAP
jgi:hypothetical protein